MYLGFYSLQNIHPKKNACSCFKHILVSASITLVFCAKITAGHTSCCTSSHGQWHGYGPFMKLGTLLSCTPEKPQHRADFGYVSSRGNASCLTCPPLPCVPVAMKGLSAALQKHCLAGAIHLPRIAVSRGGSRAAVPSSCLCSACAHGIRLGIEVSSVPKY